MCIVFAHGIVFLRLSAKLDPATPFGNKPIAIPGKLEVEDFDKGSPGLAYSDADMENQGNAYRESGVDVVGLNCIAVAEGSFVKGSDCEGYAVGYTNVGEWMRYNVNVTKAGKYYLVVRVSSGVNNSSFRLFLDDKAVTDSIAVPLGKDWDTYSNVNLTTAELTEGEHALKIQITGSFVNIDWLHFCAEKDCADTVSTAIHIPSENHSVQFDAYANGSDFNVFAITGKYLGRIESDGANFASGAANNDAFVNKMKRAGFINGVYIVRAVKGTKALKILVK